MKFAKVQPGKYDFKIFRKVFLQFYRTLYVGIAVHAENAIEDDWKIFRDTLYSSIGNTFLPDCENYCPEKTIENVSSRHTCVPYMLLLDEHVEPPVHLYQQSLSYMKEKQIREIHHTLHVTNMW